MSPLIGNPEPVDPVVVGRVVRPRGLAGELVVDSTGTSPVFAPGEKLWVGGCWRKIRAVRLIGARWAVSFEGIEDRDAAEALRDADVLIESTELPELEGDRYYVHDLIGCRVEDPAGCYLGEVVGVVPGPQDWLEIRRDIGERGLVPMVGEFLKDVDVKGRRIVVDAPEGLLEATRG